MQALAVLVRSRIPSGPLTFVRAIVGIAAAVDALITWGTLSRLGQQGILALPILPLPRLPTEWVLAFEVMWVGSAIAFACGWVLRLTGPVLFGTLTYVLLLDQQTYSNHLYLLVLVVGLVSVGLWRTPDGDVPWWPAFLLRTQLTVAYGFAAASKVNAAFVSGAVIYVNLSDWLVGIPGVGSFPVVVSMAILSIATEFFLAWGLWSARWRLTAATVGVLFHSSLILSMDDPTGFGLAVFGSVCVSLYVLFFDLRPRKVTVYFDDSCGVCSALIRRVQYVDRYRLIEAISNSHWVASGSVVDTEDTIIVVDGAGNTSTRSRGMAAIAGALPWPYAVLRLLSLRGIESIANLAYDLVARHRRRLSMGLGLRACALASRPSTVGRQQDASKPSLEAGGPQSRRIS